MVNFRVANLQPSLTAVVSGTLRLKWAAQEAWRSKRNAHDSNKQRDKLLAIIRRCGFINPIIVEENDNVIAGHSILSA